MRDTIEGKKEEEVGKMSQGIQEKKREEKGRRRKLRERKKRKNNCLLRNVSGTMLILLCACKSLHVK